MPSPLPKSPRELYRPQRVSIIDAAVNGVAANMSTCVSAAILVLLLLFLLWWRGQFLSSINLNINYHETRYESPWPITGRSG